MTDRRVLKNKDGTIVSDDNPLATKPQSFHFNVISGNFDNLVFGADAGNNPGVSANAEESVNNVRLETGTGSLYPYLSADTKVFLSSSSASDTQIVALIGFDDTYTRVVRLVTLSGQTPVASSADIFRIRAVAIVSAPQVVAVGNIYVSTDDTDITAGVPNTLSKVLGKIDVGFTQGFLPFEAVPVGTKGFFYNFIFNSSKATDAEITLRFRLDKDDDFSKSPPFELFQNSATVNELAGTTLPAKAEIDAIVFSPTAGSKATAQFSSIFTTL